MQGEKFREWIYVDDHCDALMKLFLEVKWGKIQYWIRNKLQ